MSSIGNGGSRLVLLRRDGPTEKHRVRLPETVFGPVGAYSEEGFKWLKNSRRNNPTWSDEGRYWEIPKAWLNDTVRRALSEFGSLYIVQPYVETEVCSPSCRDAKRFECNCTCMGVNHGSKNHSGWLDITDAFSVKFGGRHVASRLLTKKPA